MAYEIFTRKIARMGTPTMSFSKIGQIRFNQAAARILQREAIEYVLLLWDSSASKLAIKQTANKKDQRAYRIRFAEKNNGAGFSAKTFMDHIGIDYTSERRSLQVDINPNAEYVIEFKIPEDFLRKRPSQPRLIGRDAIVAKSS